ncbi:MAG: transposase [Clostridia bacterium]|nr:transposase [Clostridia bacterium]
MELPKRRPTRLKSFDYSTNGAYFITICTHNRQKTLSKIVVGEGLAPPEVKLTKLGEITREQLLLLEKRFENIKIDRFVIMPNHIHLIIFINNDSGGASPSPTVCDVICAFKSKSVSLCKKAGYLDKVFQRSFHDRIIRNRREYEKITKYIYENPVLWEEDCFYSKDI